LMFACGHTFSKKLIAPLSALLQSSRLKLIRRRRPIYPQHEGQSQSVHVAQPKTCQPPLRSSHHTREHPQKSTLEILAPEPLHERMPIGAPNPTNLEPSVPLAGNDELAVELVGRLLLGKKSPVVENSKLDPAESHGPARERAQPGPDLRPQLDGTGQLRLTPHLLVRLDVVGGQAVALRPIQGIVQRERGLEVRYQMPPKMVPYVRIYPYEEGVLPEKDCQALDAELPANGRDGRRRYVVELDGLGLEDGEGDDVVTHLRGQVAEAEAERGGHGMCVRACVCV
jgi:hypothetical protein